MTDDLPTPPLPEAMARTRALGGTAVWGASSRAFQRARAITADRSSASMAAIRTSTEVTQSRARVWLTTSFSIWVRKGQAAMVRATSTVTRPASSWMARTMPRSTMVSPSSGSTTSRRRSRTSSSRGEPSSTSGRARVVGVGGHGDNLPAWTEFPG